MKFTEYKYERIDFDKVCNFYEESTQKIKASANLNEIVKSPKNSAHLSIKTLNALDQPPEIIKIN